MGPVNEENETSEAFLVPFADIFNYKPKINIKSEKSEKKEVKSFSFIYHKDEENNKIKSLSIAVQPGELIRVEKEKQIFIDYGDYNKYHGKQLDEVSSSEEEKFYQQLQKEHVFYKNFFDNYLQTKKDQVEEIKNKLNGEEKELLITYLGSQENITNTGLAANKKKSNKTKKSLLKKLSEEEFDSLVKLEREITKLEKERNAVSSNQEQFQTQIELSPK